MKKQIHFIGIGGIGVSALAKYYLAKGWEVSGSDLSSSEITKQLEDMGATIHIGKPNPSLVKKDIAKVVFTPAAPKNHGERKEARKKGIPEFSYPQALGELTREHYTIAVSGTHGKSTTTSMIGLMLAKTHLDPTVIVGTKLKEFGDSNCRVGKSKYLVIEADEHFASFLNYRPQIMVLTSLEADHLDFYKTLGNLKRTFKKYVSLLNKDGVIIANRDDKNIREVLKKSKNRILWYSLEQKEALQIKKILKIPGEHNVSNALGALLVAKTLNIPDKKALKALSSFQGSWRRFEVFQLEKPKPFTLVSDYGHHPTEIAVTLKAAREKWPKKEICLVYQPHQYQRTFYLFKEFVKALSEVPVQRLILVDIYDVAGREEGSIKKKVSSQKLLQAIKKKKPAFEALHIPTIQDAEQYLRHNLKSQELVVVMGAGDIYKLTLQLTRGS